MTSAGAGEKSPFDCRIFYKIGDLGHVASLDSDHVPEEGDCRYMAPELLLDATDRERLPKADVFSLALTLYECATLAEMPRNSGETNGALYEALRQGGSAPGLEKRSKDFQHLIRVSLGKCESKNYFSTPFPFPIKKIFMHLKHCFAMVLTALAKPTSFFLSNCSG